LLRDLVEKVHPEAVARRRAEELNALATSELHELVPGGDTSPAAVQVSRELCVSAVAYRVWCPQPLQPHRGLPFTKMGDAKERVRRDRVRRSERVRVDERAGSGACVVRAQRVERWLQRELPVETLRKCALAVVQEEVRLLQRKAAALESARDRDELRPLVRGLVRAEGHAEGDAGSRRVARLVAVQLVVAHGAEVDAREEDDGWTPLLSAAEAGDESVVRALAGAGADLNRATTGYGCTPLYTAAHGGKVEVVRALVEAGADLNQATTDDGCTPLFIAASKGKVEVVRALTEAGADPHQAAADGRTPLAVAESLGSQHPVWVFLSTR